MSAEITPLVPIPTVLLTNDDGPCSEDESPFIYPFSQVLISSFLSSDPEKLKVVLPDSQKSWIGKAYIIKDRLSVTNYDPSTRQSSHRGDDRFSWKLVSGTPASCSNLGLFNLFPGQIDLVISGPNFGRNTSTAFSLSSGTIGAAMDAALSKHKSIALSYGVFERPISTELLEAANRLAVKIIERLWRIGFTNFGDKDAADLYSVNIPLVPAIISDPKVIWTTEATTRYGRLFLSETSTSQVIPTKPAEIDETSTHLDPSKLMESTHSPTADAEAIDFVFKPDISSLIDPNDSQLVPGTDAWALNKGFSTVTPLQAAFKAAKPPACDTISLSAGELPIWKVAF
ncbi:hypothetical protein O181_091018 [Austropuccinia psidii MF-1]|uniref:Survival protein SurE-like phosphatase/nucleotidase domain-containing protein n=1 Tax=Austropuccinia psidii MF-1 TaxID=1389203 RepID=A0A9Q3IW18_9BASI|nr:hypothetical protein [Austropuccinia psidii MF-1]